MSTVDTIQHIRLSTARLPLAESHQRREGIHRSAEANDRSRFPVR